MTKKDDTPIHAQLLQAQQSLAAWDSLKARVGQLEAAVFNRDEVTPQNAWEGNVPDRKDAPQYPQERETVDGDSAKVICEAEGVLFGLVYGADSARPRVWFKGNLQPYYGSASDTLLPLTPPEPEVVEVDTSRNVCADGRLYPPGYRNPDTHARIRITGHVPARKPHIRASSKAPTYRAPILTDERREALRYAADMLGDSQFAATLRDMLGKDQPHD